MITIRRPSAVATAHGLYSACGRFPRDDHVMVGDTLALSEKLSVTEGEAETLGETDGLSLALGALGDARAIPPLGKILAHAADDKEKEAAKKAIDAITNRKSA